MKKIYVNLGKLLENKGISRYKAVEALDTSYTVINNIINNKVKSMRLETMLKLCELLECTPNDLFIIEYKEN